MKQLLEGVQGYGESQGYEVIVQDPKLDPQKQVTDLQTVIESGKAAGVWSIAIAPPSMTASVQTALEKGVPMILNGTPQDYGLEGLEPGVSFSTIDYEAQGTAAGEELANCINEREDGKAEVLFVESAPGTAGKEELEGAVKAALAAGAPDADMSPRSRSATAPPRRPTPATRSRATRTSPRSSARTTKVRSAPSAPSRRPARTSRASPRPAATTRPSPPSSPVTSTPSSPCSSPTTWCSPSTRSPR